ncbi:MAG TPA: queuosine precursor transporter [Sphaerochaeta sp.]|nr:queuosine precursor transporter [Sphaerochaeta sp.]
MNELLWFLLLVLDFAAIMLAYRFWGKLGLYIWIPISIILANIQVTKNVSIFGIEATLGNIVYATSFLVTDILSEIYGKKESSKAVKFGFFALLSMTVLMQVALLFEPSSSDIAHPALETIFGLMPRIAIASLVAYLLSNTHDIWAFAFWKEKKPGRGYLWLRNNLSTFASQLIDTLVFTFIAFWGVYPSSVLIQILISTFVLKWVVAVFDTPFIYLARHWYERGKIPTPTM